MQIKKGADISALLNITTLNYTDYNLTIFTDADDPSASNCRT